MTIDSFSKNRTKYLTEYANKEYSFSGEKVLFNNVEKQLKKLPQFIRMKLLAWARSVELKGLRNVRKIVGYHDEPLKGSTRSKIDKAKQGLSGILHRAN